LRVVMGKKSFKAYSCDFHLWADSRFAASDSVLQDVIVGHIPIDGNAIDLEVKGLEGSVVCEPSSRMITITQRA
jgi:hypothetical protein